MHGGAISLARQFLKLDKIPDVILATDMLNLPVFLSLTRQKLASTPIALYFHENQLTYPWSDHDRDIDKGRDHHYTFINYTSALAADRIAFNSAYHQRAFLDELPGFLKAFPDRREMNLAKALPQKSRVLPIGLEFSRFDQFKRAASAKEGPPVLLWNHRWEYDKNPEAFLKALLHLTKKNLDFRLILLGERYEQYPPAFDEIQKRFADKLLQAGYAESFSAYAQWVCRADILPVTSKHDFFGISVVEAIYCNLFPILPNRLAYPEHIPPAMRGNHLYESQSDLNQQLEAAVININRIRQVRTELFVKHYDWQSLAPEYDQWLTQLAESHQSN